MTHPRWSAGARRHAASRTGEGKTKGESGGDSSDPGASMRRFTVRRVIIVLLLLLGGATALALLFPTRMCLFQDFSPTDRLWMMIVVCERHAELCFHSASNPSVVVELERRSESIFDSYRLPKREDSAVYVPGPRKLRSFWCDWGPVSYQRCLDQRTGEYRMFTSKWLSIRTHLWLPLVLLLAYPVIAFIRGPVRRWHRRRHNKCVACGYDLTGNVTGICPECATAVRRMKLVPKEPPKTG